MNITVIKRRIIIVIVMILMLTTICGCASKERKEQLVVFAAASLTETLTEIGREFEAENEGIEVIYNFDSSGSLVRQIEEGAYCDVFISASAESMNKLRGDSSGSGYIVADAENVPVRNELVLATDNPPKVEVQSLEDMKVALEENTTLLSMGNADVPAGCYASLLLKYLGIDEAEVARRGAITYAGNVKEIVTQIKEGAAQLGLVYRTDAAEANLYVIDTASEEMCGEIIYPCCVMSGSNMPDEAESYLKMLESGVSRHIFEEAGFIVNVE